jgi:DNA-directed RNA polymerase specialized sigma24 family protein
VIFAKKVKTEDFESTALPYFDDLYRTATRVVGDRTEAEDLIQEAYLPQDFRQVLLLADVQEFSYKEVAEALQIPLGTVMSHLSRGRRILRGEVANVAESMDIRKTQGAGQRQ